VAHGVDDSRTLGLCEPDVVTEAPSSVDRRIDRRVWLTRNLVILTLVSLMQDAASELLFPLLPALLIGVMAAPPVVLGIIEGVADATAGITKYFAGRWSDRRGRKPFIGAGYGLAAAGKAVVAAAGVWPVVLVGRVLDRFGKGVRSAPRDALIAASVPPEAMGRAFGFHRTGDTLGAVIGPLLGLWALAAMHDNLHRALWWAVVPATLSALLVFFVRDTTRALATPPGPDDASAAPVDAAKEPLPRRFWMVTTVLVSIALVNFSDALLLLRLVQLGYSTTQMVLGYVLFNTVYTLASYPAGVLTDRWPRPIVYGVGLLAFAVGYIGLGSAHHGPMVFVFIGVYGLFPAFTDGVGKAWIATIVPRRHMGRAQGIYQALTSGAILFAGVWAGLTWRSGAGNGTLPLTIAGVVGLVGALGLLAIGAVRPSAAH
jgi:MFS family permease